MGRKVVVKIHGQYPMKNTKMIVDNRHHTVVAAIARARSDGTTAFGRHRWCMPGAAVSFLVRKFTKLSQIVFSIVDNSGCRYDSCIVANTPSLPSNS
jgi:hypothetical protein